MGFGWGGVRVCVCDGVLMGGGHARDPPELIHANQARWESWVVFCYWWSKHTQQEGGVTLCSHPLSHTQTHTQSDFCDAPVSLIFRGSSAHGDTVN